MTELLLVAFAVFGYSLVSDRRCLSGPARFGSVCGLVIGGVGGAWLRRRVSRS